MIRICYWLYKGEYFFFNYHSFVKTYLVTTWSLSSRALIVEYIPAHKAEAVKIHRSSKSEFSMFELISKNEP